MIIILKAIFLSSKAQVQPQKNHPSKNDNVQARPITLIMVLMSIHFGISVNTILSNITQMNKFKAIVLVFANKFYWMYSKTIGFMLN